MAMAPETTDVREVHRFDEAKLGEYLEAQIEGFAPPIAVRQFSGGQSNPTFHIRDQKREYVMRKKPPGKLLPSAHQVDREYRVTEALHGTGVPTAKPYHLCMDDEIIGTAFYVMDYVKGRILRDPILPGMEPSERRAIYDEMNRVLANLALIDVDEVGLQNHGKPGNYYARQISRWSRQYVLAKTDDVATMDKLMEWLPENIPPDEKTTIVHGDYRLENTIIHPTEPKILAVLDWELSTLGQALADLAYNCMSYHLKSPRGVTGIGDVDYAATGIPSEKDYLADYCRRTGRDGIPHWNFYLAFSMFRSASIVQGVYKRGLDGIASSPTAADSSRLVAVKSVSARGWELVQEGADG